MDGFKKKVTSGLRWSIVDTVTNKGFGLLTILLLTRILSPDDFGLMGIILVITSVGSLIIEGGMGISLVRDKKAGSADYGTVLITNVGLSLLMYILLFFAAPYVALFYNRPELTNLTRVLGVNFIVQSFAVVHINLLTKHMNFRLLSIATMPGTVIGGVAGFIAAYTGLGVWSLVIMPITTQSIKTGLLWVLSQHQINYKFSKELFLKHFKFGFRLVLSGVLSTIFMELYALLIGKRFSITSLGYYNRARTFSLFAVSIISTVISSVSYPMLSSIQDDHRQISIQYQRILRSAFVLLVGLIVVLFSAADSLFLWAFTEKWSQFIPIFKLLCLSAVLVPIHEINLNVFKIFDKTDLMLRLELVKKVLILMVFATGYFFGMWPMYVAMVISSYMALVINSYYSGKLINYSTQHQLSDMLPIAVLGLSSGLIAFGINTLITVDHLLIQSIFMIFLSGGSFLILAFVSQNRGFLDLLSLLKALTQKSSMSRDRF